METTTTTTTYTSPTPAPRKRSSRLRRLAAGAMTMLAVAGFAVGMSASGASAVANGAQWGDFTGYCGYNRMRAEMPFYSTHYPGWNAAAAPILFKWNASNGQWMVYAKGYAQALTGWVQPGAEAFNNLTPGYYQMQYVVQWSYNGVAQPMSMIRAAHHIQDVANDNLWPYALNTHHLSTDSYCYEGN